jgi:hypothetical protein
MSLARTGALTALCSLPALAVTVSGPTPIPGLTGQGGAPMVQTDPAAAALAPNHILVTWSDFRASGQLSNIWMMRVDSTAGVLGSSVANFPISPSRHWQSRPDIACGPTTCLVTWIEDPWTLKAARVDANLQVLDQPPLTVHVCADKCFDVHSVWEGAGWFVAFDDTQVMGRRVSAAGALDPTTLSFGAAAFTPDPKPACDGVVTRFIYADATNGLSTAGVVAGVNSMLSPVQLTASTATLLTWNLASKQDGGFYADWSQQGAVVNALLGERLDSVGTPTMPVITVAPNISGWPVQPLMTDGNTQFVVYWNAANGEMEQTSVSMSTGTAGPTVSASIGNFSEDYAAAALPSGPHLVVTTVPNAADGSNTDLQFAALDSMPLRVLPAQPIGDRAQVDGLVGWTGSDFLVVTFEELDATRLVSAYRFSPTGTIGPRVMLMDNAKKSLQPVAASTENGNVVLAWVDYGTLSLTRLDPTGNPAAFAQAAPVVFGLGWPSITGSAGQVAVAFTGYSSACLTTAPELFADSSLWKTACRGTTAQFVAVKASPTRLAALQVAQDWSMSLSLSPWPAASADAGALFDSAIPLSVAANIQDRRPALATDGTQFLAVWWELDNSFTERVEAVLVTPNETVTALPELSARVEPGMSDRSNIILFASFDGVQFWVAYMAPTATGGYDAFMRPIATDGTVGPEQTLAATLYDQQLEGLAPGAPGQMLALTRSFEPDAGAMRLWARQISSLPAGAICAGNADCSSGVCTAMGTCAVPGSDAGAMSSDGGSTPDGGPSSGDGGSSSADGGPGSSDVGPVVPRNTPQTFEVRCGCQSGGGLVWRMLLAACALRRRRRPS